MIRVISRKNGPHRFSQGVPRGAYLLGKPNEPPHMAPKSRYTNPRLNDSMSIGQLLRQPVVGWDSVPTAGIAPGSR